MSKRIIQEYKKYQQEKDQLSSNGLIDLYPDDESLNKWRAIISPNCEQFQNTVWILDILIPSNYPSQPPKIKFHKTNKRPNIKITGKKLIYQIAPPHVNINFDTGEICLDILDKSWTPLWSISSTCIAIIMLLGEGEQSSPLNVDILNLMRLDKLAWNGLILYYIGKYGVN